MMLKSDNKCEKKLGVQLSKLYVDSVKASFEFKEKEYQRKLIEMTIKRESSRIAVKRQLDNTVKAKEAKIMEVKKRLEEAMKEKHRLVKEKEEQLRKAQERQKRLLMRQKTLEGGCLRSICYRSGGMANLFAFFLERDFRAEMRNTRAKEGSGTIVFSDSEESIGDDDRLDGFVLNENMQKLMSDLMIEEDSWIFLDPIDTAFAPDYYSVIKVRCFNWNVPEHCHIPHALTYDVQIFLTIFKISNRVLKFY